MTRYGTFYSLWVPLGIRSGLWEDFGRFLIDFGRLLGPLGRPFWEPLGTLGQFLDLQTSKRRGFSTPRLWINFGLHSGRPKNVKMELSCTREHRFQYSRDVHMGSILDSIWKQKGNQNPNYTPSGEHCGDLGEYWRFLGGIWRLLGGRGASGWAGCPARFPGDCPGDGNPGALDPTLHQRTPSSWLYRIQDTGYRIQDTTCSIQDTGIKGCKYQDARIHRIQDAGSSKFLAAWWPLYRGAGGYIFVVYFG